MRTFKIVVILASASMIIGSALAGDRVVAKYNGKEILKSEVENSIKSVMNGALPNNKKDLDDLDKGLRDRIVLEYVSQKVLGDKAQSSDIQKSDLYKKQLKMVQDQIAVNLFLDHYAKRHLTDASIKSEYNNYTKSLKENDELKVSHILVQSQDNADDLYKKIKNGSLSFEDAAKNSLDGTKDKGGDIGYISRGQTVPEFEEKAYSLKKGQVSEPVKTQFGWHIIKVTDIKKRALPKFDDVKNMAEQAALGKIKQKYITDTMQDSGVEIL
jgi:peptidyl-prolyl cis-trans isomerase C